MSAPEPHGTAWHKSGYSAESGGCVEVARAKSRSGARLQKDPDGPALGLPTSAWRTFLTTVTH